MASSTIPVSNVGGNNQTSPGVSNSTSATSTLQLPFSNPNIASPGAAATANPLIPSAAPISSSSVTGGGPGTSVPNAGGLVNSPANVAGTTGALQKQESDIYGKGIGGAIANLLGGIGGVDSATLQEYIKSLAPQEATASANLDASLGAGGVGANSSVAAIGNANLQAQEFADIAGESANLTQSGQNLQASILTGQQQDAANQVAYSGWNVLGSVIGGAGQAAGSVLGSLGDAGLL